MIKPGPLHDLRFEIYDRIKSKIQTGDIFFRASNAKGPLGIPFSKLVTWLSDSQFSHASILIEMNNEPFLVEVNDQGTQTCRIVDWLDYCWNGKLAIYRPKNMNEEMKELVRNSIQNFLQKDPEYDFTFTDESKFYCTESVVQIYKDINVKIAEPRTIKEIVPTWAYVVLYIGNFIISKISNCSIPLNKELYYVGNHDHGMMSSKDIEMIHYFSLE